MAIANTSITDTYFVWLARVNQMATSLNALDTANVSTLQSNSSPLVLAGDTKRNSSLFFNLVISSNTADVATTNIASPFLTNTAAQIARSAFNNANTTLVTASAAFAAANNANLSAGAAYAQANAAFITASAAFAAANAVPGTLALSTAQSSYGFANTVNLQSIVAYNQGNTAYNQANAAYNKANVYANVSVSGIVRFANTIEFMSGTANLAVAADVSQSSLAWSNVTYAATITISHKDGINRRITLAGNPSISAITNPIVGMPFNLALTQ